MKLMIRSAADAAERQMSYAKFLARADNRTLFIRSTFMSAYSGFSNGFSGDLKDARPMTKVRSVDGTERIAPVHTAELGQMMLSTELMTIGGGTPVFVTAQAHEIIDEAAALLPNGEVLLPAERDSRPLMLWFEQPYRYELLSSLADGSALREDWRVDAITIEPVNDMGSSYNDSRGPGIQVTVYGRPYNNVDHDAFAEIDGGLLPVDVIGIGCNVAWDHPHAAWVIALKKWIIAMYRLMGDHIERERIHIDRATRRRLTRLSFPEDGYITELRLRKVAYGDESEGGQGAALRFRHRVRGHWRKFYCPSTGKPVGDPEAYRHRYVNDYVRGPKTGPLVESQQVVVLAR